MTNPALRFSAVLIALVCLASCSSDKRSSDKPPATQTSAAASQPAATPQPAEVQQPKSAAAAPEAAGQKPSGPPATDKYQFGLTNYAKVPVTVSLNGEWLGQWDSSNSVPIQPVQGKNQLTVEVAGQPTGQLIVEVQATRDGQNVRILSANAQAGTHTYTFIAK
jgi:hypothetical protein